ncbi:magnesium transporter CorA family protein [Ruminiclostridium herbifermentans]|uniref:Magnesium transporter CorA family protein n=1 Tax=Ruminiclostridium herbifermentans TaxID=2488810 RepID=A0A4V6EP73_9FIRM|nr:magnesium transporter CorA family protein [Ruminiclostridium herbifermentans]QNU68349.1 magnesium transporter CorA family protein [Ruminiclostridium herbifermentans]
MLSLSFFQDKKQTPQIEKAVTEIKQITFNGLTWIDITKPTKKEIDMLEKKYEFHELPLEDCLTEHQRSKVDEYDDYCFIVMHFPRYRKDTMRLDSEEIDIFLGHNYLITLHEGELKPLVAFSNMCNLKQEARENFMAEGSALLLYEIIKRLFDYCFPMLDKIGNMLDGLNKKIFREQKRVMLEEISIAKMQIINYRRILKPLRPVILILEKAIRRYLPEDMEMYFDDITDKAEKIWDMLENYKEVVEAIDATYESLTSHRMNNLMRTFTTLQVIVFPMTLVSGLFSMNVEGIPLAKINFAFWIVFGMIFVPMTIIGLLMVFKRNKWF